MKTEHYRALHLSRFPNAYAKGRDYADTMCRNGYEMRHWKILETARDAINHRRYIIAAYWLGYADRVTERSRKTPFIARDAPHVPRMQSKTRRHKARA